MVSRASWPLMIVQLLLLVVGGSAAWAANLQSPRWKVQVLIYDRIDFTFTDSKGVAHRITASMTEEERSRAANAAKKFLETDVPALTSGNMRPLGAIRFVPHPLTKLGPGYGTCEYPFWPDPVVTAPDRDTVNFDSTIVLFQESAFDWATGKPMFIGCWGGLTWPTGTATTYASFIFRILPSTNVFKHEWGHSILFYYDSAGTAPKPTIDNHNGTYVQCGTGIPYLYIEDSTVPYSYYHNLIGYTHDYYSGTIATADQPNRCLGITPAAWASGGPVTRPIKNPGDLNGDKSVDTRDLELVMKRLNQPVAGPSDPMDLDYDGKITVLDARILVTLCARQYCAQ